MSRQAPTTTMTTAQYVARFKAEKIRLARDYCGIFKFWRDCAFKPCRKARRCIGDPHGCLKRRATEIPRDRQWLARQAMLASTPADAGPPERTAREILPGYLGG